jgi:hypothetical protein
MFPYWNYINESYVAQIWPESADLDPAAYASLMSTANALCRAYAPVLPDETAVPDPYKLAEIITARDIWSKMGGGNADHVGPDDMQIPTAPLIWLARDLLRPKTSPLGRLR